MFEVLPWPWLVVLAMGAEFCLRWPSRLTHPVVWIGHLIGLLEKRWNHSSAAEKTLKRRGIATVVILVTTAALVGLVVQLTLVRAFHEWGALVAALVGIVGLAAGSLHQHVAAIIRPLSDGNLAQARVKVGYIVGRDTAVMDQTDVATAALESLAESFNDGVVAPVFWFCIGGLPALFAYKAINTADSMIGHMEPRWRSFGWASAKIDDVVNWIPARLSGVLIAGAALFLRSGARAFSVMTRDARKHASPNAGWPEAAMAGALGVKLGGAVFYDGVRCDRPQFGDGPQPSLSDLNKGLDIYRIALVLLAGLLLAGGLLWRL